MQFVVLVNYLNSLNVKSQTQNGNITKATFALILARLRHTKTNTDNRTQPTNMIIRFAISLVQNYD